MVYGILGLGCYSICFAAFFLAKKKTKAEKDREGTMFEIKQEPLYELQIGKEMYDDGRSYSQRKTLNAAEKAHFQK